MNSEWKQVSFAGDMHREEGEPDGICTICAGDYADCGCPGPTMDDHEYLEVDGVLYARPVIN